MDRKYLTAPFDMSEYIYGKRFVIGGVDFDLEDKNPEEDTHNDDNGPDSLTPADKR